MVAVGNIIFNHDTTWLSQIIVHPSQRNRGLGTILTQALIDRIDSSKYKSVLLDATFLGYPVYRKIGFELVSEYQHLVGPNNGSNSVANSSCIKLYEQKYLGQILALDKIATGESREMKLVEEMAGAVLWVDKEMVEAAYFPRLGKGLIIGRNTDAGIELMKHRMHTQQSAMFPVENEMAAHFLLENHWTESRRSRRMILGKKPDWKPGFIFNVISGAFG